MSPAALPPKRPRAKPYRLSEGEVKALVRFRDGYRCRYCGMTSRRHHRRYKTALEVHRLHPGSRYTVKGCIALCKACHALQPRSPRGTLSVPSRPGFALPLILDDALEAAVRASRPKTTKTAIVAVAIEEYLSKLGFWPPPASSEEDHP